MKHIKQGPSECKLATIAMLAGVSLQMIRQIALKTLNISHWDDIILDTDKFFQAIDVILSKFKPDGKVLLLSDILPLLNDANAISTATTKKYFPGEKLPLKGKGEIYVQWLTNAAHSVAYENGMIFDPEQDREYSFDEWLELPEIKDLVKYFII